MNQLIPYICVGDARAAIEWYADVFGAAVVMGPFAMDDGRIGHVEMAIGDPPTAQWMISDELPGLGIAVPDKERGAAVTLRLQVPDVDAVAERAKNAGGTLRRGPEDEPGIGRLAAFHDPFGHRWFLTQAR